MVAGSSTGSILAASLAVPMTEGSSEPRYYANDVIKYYEVEGPTVFEEQGISTGWLVTYSLLGALFGAMLGLKRGYSMYEDPLID
jgi:predicted acylesterase/phospholipase RssA